MSNTKKVTLYTVAWCPHCVAARGFLQQEGIRFQEYDVDADDAAWRRALALTCGQDIVPVVEIDGQAVFGAFTGPFQSRIRGMLEMHRR
ncbi:MAG: glutaredoxin family protein [Candidatus Ozemobacteraceae bacterium]